jgi:GntR family transcriptional regulator
MYLAKSSPIPLYYQLVERLKEQIANGEIQPGAKLPSERDLAKATGVSRMTARQALAYLARAGYLDVRHGVGSFVAAPKFAYSMLHLRSFTESMAQQGYEVTSTVLEQKRQLPAVKVTRDLALEPGEEVVKLVRLRHVNGDPLLLETSYIRAALCPGLEQIDLTGSSLYAELDNAYGLRIGRAHQHFEATFATTYEQQIFKMAGEMAMLLSQGVVFTVQDQPLESFKSIYRGDRCAFRLESQRVEDAGENSVTHVSVRLV